jgi:ribosomal protein L24
MSTDIDSMILRIDSGAGETTFTMDITSVDATQGSVKIFWGDGQMSPGFTTGVISHTYASMMTLYDITITGQFTKIKIVSHGHMLSDILQFGNCGIESLEDAFDDSSWIKTVSSPATDNLSKCTNIKNAFNNCRYLTSFQCDFPNVTDVTGAWQKCPNLETFKCDLPSLVTIKEGDSFLNDSPDLKTFESNLSSLVSSPSPFPVTNDLTTVTLSGTYSILNPAAIWYNQLNIERDTLQTILGLTSFLASGDNLYINGDIDVVNTVLSFDSVLALNIIDSLDLNTVEGDLSFNLLADPSNRALFSYDLNSVTHYIPYRPDSELLENQINNYLVDPPSGDSSSNDFYKSIGLDEDRFVLDQFTVSGAPTEFDFLVLNDEIPDSQRPIFPIINRMYTTTSQNLNTFDVGGNTLIDKLTGQIRIGEYNDYTDSGPTTNKNENIDGWISNYNVETRTYNTYSPINESDDTSYSIRVNNDIKVFTPRAKLEGLDASDSFNFTPGTTKDGKGTVTYSGGGNMTDHFAVGDYFMFVDVSGIDSVEMKIYEITNDELKVYSTLDVDVNEGIHDFAKVRLISNAVNNPDDNQHYDSSNNSLEPIFKNYWDLVIKDTSSNIHADDVAKGGTHMFKNITLNVDKRDANYGSDESNFSKYLKNKLRTKLDSDPSYNELQTDISFSLFSLVTNQKLLKNMELDKADIKLKFEQVDASFVSDIFVNDTAVLNEKENIISKIQENKIQSNAIQSMIGDIDVRINGYQDAMDALRGGDLAGLFVDGTTGKFVIDSTLTTEQSAAAVLYNEEFDKKAIDELAKSNITANKNTAEANFLTSLNTHYDTSIEVFYNTYLSSNDPLAGEIFYTNTVENHIVIQSLINSHIGFDASRNDAKDNKDKAISDIEADIAAINVVMTDLRQKISDDVEAIVSLKSTTSNDKIWVHNEKIYLKTPTSVKYDITDVNGDKHEIFKLTSLYGGIIHSEPS